MKPDYTKIKFEDLEFKKTLNENEIDPAEKARVDELIEQLKDAVDKVCKRLKDEGRKNTNIYT
jgi:hypothetical protein